MGTLKRCLKLGMKLKNDVKEQYMKHYQIIIPISCMALLTLSGCNTIAGFGEDITKSAEWTKQKMGGSSEAPNQPNQPTQSGGSGSSSGKASVEVGGPMK